MKNNKSYFIIFVFVFIIFFCSLFTNHYSISAGDLYFSRLQQWYSLAAQNDWTGADKLEKKYLDPADTIYYKSTHSPVELEKYVDKLSQKKDKSVEDWLEMAHVQSILGKTNDAYISISTAHSLDPIRDDITQLYYQTSK
jgi:hypothetical protein